MRNYDTLDTKMNLHNLMKEYAKYRKPINIDFRKLLSEFSSPDRATHLIHTYPAKLLMHIPIFFLANNILSEPGDLVLDPFAGSGTVLLEAQLAGRNSIGADSNPLARFISEVKTTPIENRVLRQSIKSLLKDIPDIPQTNNIDVVNLNYWFYPRVIKQLKCILEAINGLTDERVSKFFLICFSQCLKKVSLADPHISVPVKLNPNKYKKGHRYFDKTHLRLKELRNVNVVSVFEKVFEANFRRMQDLNSHVDPTIRANIICSDARKLNNEFLGDANNSIQPDDSVQLIITSPPYPGAQKYIRSSSLSLGWLGLCRTSELRKYKSFSIGREEYYKSEYSDIVTTEIRSADDLLEEIYSINKKRAAIAGTYLVEMREVLKEQYRVLKKGGSLVLIAANNNICGKTFKTQQYLRLISQEIGFTESLMLIDDIKSRGLMTKRNSTASMILSEWVMVFRKE